MRLFLHRTQTTFRDDSDVCQEPNRTIERSATDSSEKEEENFEQLLSNDSPIFELRQTAL